MRKEVGIWLRRYRLLAIVVALGLGIGTTYAVDWLVTPGLSLSDDPRNFTDFGIILGVGGLSYYYLHYQNAFPSSGNTYEYLLVQNAVIIWLIAMLLGVNGGNFEQFVPQIVAIGSLAHLLTVSGSVTATSSAGRGR